MEKQELLKLRKKAAALLSAGVMTMSFAGCQKNTNTNTSATTTQEQTTEMLTEESQMQTLPIVDEEDNLNIEEVDYKASAREVYENNLEFWSMYAYERAIESDAEGNKVPLSKEVVFSNIENVIKLMNGEVKDFSSSEVNDIYADLRYMLCPDKLTDTLNNVRNAELGYYEVEGQISLPFIPDLTKFAISEQTREMLAEYTTNANLVISDLNSTNTVSKETKDIVTKTLLTQEESCILNPDYMQTKNSADGVVRTIVAVDNSGLYTDATGETRIKSDKVNSGEMRISPETQDEAIVYSMYLMGATDTLTDEQKIILQNLLVELRPIKHIELMCEYLTDLGIHADQKENVITGKAEDKPYGFSYSTDLA